MTSRERFESWMTDEQWFHGNDFEWDERRNCYAQFGIHLAYKAFLAAETAAEQKLTELAAQLANAESKCRQLAAENAGLKDLARGWANATDDRLFEEHGEIFHDSIDACEEELKTICPSTDAFLAEVRASAIPDDWKLVPQQMYLDAEDIQVICMQCGNGDKKGYGDYEDGILWVGELSNDGEMKYGLNIANANYPEEGSITVFEFDKPEFAAQLRQGAKS
ncbi:hypothetical protein ACV3J7_04960 [Salmonella enterica]